MTQGTWASLEFMLQHISKILEAYPITIGDYVYGQRVKCLENRGEYDVITIGTIRGFEYFDDESHDDVGIFYQVKVESGSAIFRDGTVRDVVSDEIERMRPEHIYPLDVNFSSLKSELTV